jgi:hypothetical protein
MVIILEQWKLRKISMEHTVFIHKNTIPFWHMYVLHVLKESGWDLYVRCGLVLTFLVTCIIWLTNAVRASNFPDDFVKRQGTVTVWYSLTNWDIFRWWYNYTAVFLKLKLLGNFCIFTRWSKETNLYCVFAISYWKLNPLHIF